MAYDQHSYQAPQRVYYQQSGQQYGGRQPVQPAEEYGTFDPYAQDVGSPYGESSNGYGQQSGGYAQDSRTQGYSRHDEQAYASQGRQATQGYGSASRSQDYQRRAPASQGGGYEQHDRQYKQPGSSNGYSQQNGGRGYDQQDSRRGHDQHTGVGYAAQPGRGYADQSGSYNPRENASYHQQSRSQGYREQAHDSRQYQGGYDRQTGVGEQPQQSYGVQTGHTTSQFRSNGYDQQQDERRYDPRYQQRAREDRAQYQPVTSPPASTSIGHQGRSDQRQPATRSRPDLNANLQSSYSAPVLQNTGPKKLTMDEWKAQEKAKMHSDAHKPKIVTQDNAFPTFPTKKAESTRGQSAMSMRSGEERPSTASSSRPGDRPSFSRHNSSQHDLTDSARPSMDHKPHAYDSSRPSIDSQHRNGSPLQRDHTSPPAVGMPPRKDSYSSSTRPVVPPLNTTDSYRSSSDFHPQSPGNGRPQTSDSRYARKPVEQPMSPLGKYAQTAGAAAPQYNAYNDGHAQPSREEEIEAEMPDFDSATPTQAAMRQRRQTIDQHLAPAATEAPPLPNFDFGFPHGGQGLERPVQPYANETQGRRSMDDARQGSRTLAHGRPPPQRFYGEGTQSRPSVDRQGTTFSDPGLQRTGSVPPPQNPDALPAHPAPVRAGLLGGTPAQAAHPPPVRNYQGSTAQPPAQPPSQPSSRAVSGGDAPKQPITHAELQQLRTQVEATPQSLSLSLTYAKKLVEAAKVLSSEGGRADTKTAAKNRERYLMEAYKRVKKLASSGYPDGQFYLADCYGQGMLGLEVDPREAFKLYQAAAKAGHATAAYRTAVCCEIGSEEGGGTSRDYPRAVQWYKRAAALGDTAAMFKVGMIALKGLLGQPRHLGEATIWLKRAAERADKDNPHALHELAQLYETANSSPEIRQKIIPDDVYALSLYKQAAELGSRNSQFRLGQCYEYGQLGLPVDHRSSIAWYSKSAAQGNHEAELALSGWYLTGAPGILQQSDVEAYLWARKAAQSEPPLAKSLFALGYYNEAGIGCPVNIDEAKRWYSRAASYKHPKALERLDAIKRGTKGGYKAMPTNARGKLNRRDQHQDENECSVM